MKKVILFLGAVATLMTSCNKSNNVTPAVAGSTAGDGVADVGYQLKATNASPAMKLTTGALVFTSAVANPKDLKMEAKQGKTELEFPSMNTSAIDLMAGAATRFGNVSLPAGAYNDIELSIVLGKNDNTPALQLKGQMNSGTKSVPVSVVINEDLEIRTEQHNATFSDDVVFEAMTSVDLAALTTGITEEMLTSAKLEDGVLVIDSNSNKTLYRLIVANFKSSHYDYKMGK